GFFFSSRRRHTRFSRDWSSDVCSSDLLQPLYAKYSELNKAGDNEGKEQVMEEINKLREETRGVYKQFVKDAPNSPIVFYALEQRSEERRVGKECRSRWSMDNTNRGRRE